MTTTNEVMGLAEAYSDAALDYGRTSGFIDKMDKPAADLLAAVESLVAERDALRAAINGLVRNCRIPTSGNDQFQQAVSAAMCALKAGQP